MDSAILHRNLGERMTAVVRGEGSWLIDSEGRRYLDASGGAAVSCLGHGHPAIIEAICAQARQLEFAHTSFFTNEPSEALAARLVALAPPGFGNGRVAFLGSGSEAMEAALKLARQYHVERGDKARSRIIARHQSYHGNSLGALAVGGHAGRRALYEPFLMEAVFVSSCNSYRGRLAGESDAAYVDRLGDELIATIERLDPGTVAAFVAEPIVGATLGSVPPVSGYFRRIREICDRFGLLFIADEVMCGMGRSGDWFAITAEGVCPDLITVAKGLGAGYQPIGAVLARENIVRAIGDGTGLLANGHTYMGHAIACAASLAVIETIDRDGLLPSVSGKGAELERLLDARFGSHPNVGDIRGRGLFWSLELVADRMSKTPFPPTSRLAARLKKTALAKGLVCYPSSGSADGVAGDHVLLAPPFTASSGELEEMVDRLDQALSAERLQSRAAA